MENHIGIAARLHANSASIRFSRTEMPIGGTPSTFLCWHTNTYELIDGHWQVLWPQATRILQPTGAIPMSM